MFGRQQIFEKCILWEHYAINGYIGSTIETSSWGTDYQIRHSNQARTAVE